jgi:hypothetical protein
MQTNQVIAPIVAALRRALDVLEVTERQRAAHASTTLYLDTLDPVADAELIELIEKRCPAPNIPYAELNEAYLVLAAVKRALRTMGIDMDDYRVEDDTDATD